MFSFDYGRVYVCTQGCLVQTSNARELSSKQFLPFLALSRTVSTTTASAFSLFMFPGSLSRPEVTYNASHFTSCVLRFTWDSSHNETEIKT